VREAPNVAFDLHRVRRRTAASTNVVSEDDVETFAARTDDGLWR